MKGIKENRRNKKMVF